MSWASGCVSFPWSCSVSAGISHTSQFRESQRVSLTSSFHVKYWAIIADNLSKARRSLGYVSVLDCEGRTIWIVDAQRDGKRFVAACDEKLAALLELEAAIRVCTVKRDSAAIANVRLKSYRLT